MSRSKVKLLAVAGFAAAFMTADVASAGLTGGDRLRPGQGFHGRRTAAPAARPSYGATYRRAQSNWATPAPVRPFLSQTQSPIYAPQVVQNRAYAPQVVQNRIYAPQVVQNRTYAPQPRVVYSQPARIVSPQPRVVYSQPRVIYSQPRVVLTQPAPVYRSTAPVVTSPPAAPAPRTASGPVVTPR